MEGEGKKNRPGKKRAPPESPPRLDLPDDKEHRARWPKVRARLRALVTKKEFDQWLAGLEFVSARKGELVLRTAIDFHAKWVDQHYADKILRLWRAGEDGDKGMSRIAIWPPDDAPHTAPAPNAARASAKPPPPAALPESLAELNMALEPHSSFDTYIVGEGNHMAAKAAETVSRAYASGPASGASSSASSRQPSLMMSNPLYIHSPVGLGKTHLLQAAVRHWSAHDGRDGRGDALFVTAQHFRSIFLGALRRKQIQRFKDSFKTVGLLAMDDIQYLTGEVTQNEFLQVFESLAQKRAQIIVSAKCPPSLLEKINSRICSRLAGGLVVDIRAADYDLRQRIVQALLERYNARAQIQPVLIDFLAENICANVREMEGALNRLLHRARHSPAPLTVSEAQDTLRDLIHAVPPQRLTIARIQQRVAEYFDIKKEDMISPSRQRGLVVPRQIAIRLCKDLTSASLPAIGRHFGRRDHTTILYSIRRAGEMMAKDPTLRADIMRIARELTAGQQE